jgi:hypothetical protein
VKEKENGNLDEEAIRQQLLDLKAEKINKKIVSSRSGLCQ